MTHEAYIGGSVIHPMGMSESPRNPSFRFFYRASSEEASARFSTPKYTTHHDHPLETDA